MATIDAVPQGEEDTSSAKKRRQASYRKDLQLQMQERDAARRRERFQGMNVNASGWLDPEKGPDRLKPLGGEGFMTDRSRRDPKVVPYHTLFDYGKLKERELAMSSSRRPQTERLQHRQVPLVIRENRIDVPEPPKIKLESLNLDPPAGLTIQPLTTATTTGAGVNPYNTSVHDAYNFYATRDLDRPAAYGSIIQPLSIPYVDNRPIIMPGQCQHVDTAPRYNPFRPSNDGNATSEIKALLGISQLENERLRNQRAKDQGEYERRMRRELEEERRKLMEQEAQARKRIEEMRREADERRREWERRMREAERLRNQKDTKKEILVVRPSSSTLLVDMEDTRRRLADERRKIEELLRAQLRAPDYTQVRLLKRPPPPPTPPFNDKADPHTLNEFSHLKHKDLQFRFDFRRMYPDLPDTNTHLEKQQAALLRYQEENLSGIASRPPKPQPGMILVQKGFRPPSWMEKSPTPFPHRLRQRDRLYTTQSVDGDLDRIYRKNQKRERAIDSIRITDTDADAVIDNFEHFKLRHNRPASTDTLADDTWLRPASVTAF